MNFQNIPRQDKVIKRAFQPKLDAMVFFDYKQIEPRLMAYYLHEIGFPRLAEWIQTGVDPYTAIARGYFGKEELTDAERQKGKQTFLSLSYGGGLPAIRRYFVDLDWQGARRVKDDFYRAWPEMALLQQMLLDRVKERGYITTLFGRHLHPESEHKVINTLIQGCAADLMRQALVKTHYGLIEKGLEAHLVSNVHDELFLDSPLDELPTLHKLVPQWMDYEPVSKVVPILADMEWTTTNWAEKSPYEEVHG